MKLIRFGPYGEEKPGVLAPDGLRYDLSPYYQDWNSSFFAADGLLSLQQLLSAGFGSVPAIPADERWGAPIARPGKIICIGLNFSDHAKETGAPIPTEPIVFLKASNTVVGPYDNLRIPRGSAKTDWEVELGVIIGKEARYLDGPGEAKDYIAGYVLNHDVSERSFQLERGGQWTKGKSCDTFNPLGPFVLTRDEMPDAGALVMGCAVNGVTRQSGNTSNMIFKVDMLVHYLSQFMTLEPGDLISTGTPAGVALGSANPEYLKEGDQVDLSIEGLGSQRQYCVSA